MVISNKMVHTRCPTSCPPTQESLQTPQSYCLMLSPPLEMKILSVLVKIFWKTEIEPFYIVRYLTWKLELAWNILWVIVYSKLSIDGKNYNNEVPGIKVFLDSNLSFTVRLFTWGLVPDLDVSKKYEKHAKPILSNLIQEC